MKRYDSYGFEHEFGIYVRWADVEQLEAERDQWKAGSAHVNGALLKRIAELEAALREAIKGHEIWESVYGSSASSREHLEFLKSHLGSTAETAAERPQKFDPNDNGFGGSNTVHGR